jgi:hypothetical protein
MSFSFPGFLRWEKSSLEKRSLPFALEEDEALSSE